MLSFVGASCILGWKTLPVLVQDALVRRGLKATLSRSLRIIVVSVCAVGAIAAWLLIENPVACVSFALACACMGALMACDLRHRILPTGFVAMFMGLSALFRLSISDLGELMLLGIPLGCVTLTLFALNAVRMKSGKSELIGSGDLRMLIPLGLFSGMSGLGHGLLATALVAGVIAVIALSSGRANRKDPIALAPALCAWLLAGTLIPLA